ncbi:MAG: hypothetical protein GY841_11795 [FCB group bacterium]|nr:hypothetical protein [FCB group bacterium]
MDYRKIIFYLIVILAIIGWRYKTGRDEAARLAALDHFGSVYAGTVVVAELYRNEPQRFYDARDSIYAFYETNADSIAAFQASFEDREEEWSQVWNDIKIKTDSLIAYFKENPVKHDPPDSLEDAGDPLLQE